MTDDLILQAVARGWCSPENSHKEMDSDLAKAIAQEIRNMLSTVPGWKLVPVEPTKEMIFAADACYFTGYTGIATAAPDTVYRAMLAAAPQYNQGNKQ